jgi:acyl carrier protein
VCSRDASYRAVPIGCPITGVSAYILDASQQPAPIGVAGELCIGGMGVARGYLNRPDLTTEKFIADPFSARPESRLYRTGDLARWLPDGSIEYLGRCDHQVKLRGFRIELGEIEALLLRHPDVLDTAVIVHEDQRGDQRLVAYVVTRGTEIDAATWRVFLSAALPDYMIPSAFVRLDALPQTPNGKLDRKALPAPRQAQRHEAQTAPRSEIERTIAAIWQELLQIERVGVNQNFFELGGHSLLLIQVHVRLRKALNVDLSVVDLFKYPTIETLARHLSQHTAAPPAGHSQIQDRARLQQEAIRRQQELAKQRRQMHGSTK